MTRKQKLGLQIVEQDAWITQHGGDLQGYVARYGSRNDPRHYGDGGEAIFAADYAALVALCDAYVRAR